MSLLFRLPSALVGGFVIAGLANLAGVAAAVVPKAELPAGLELVSAAAPPLVNFPIMGCLDDTGRLFVGDAAGLNLNRKALEEQLPNRVLLLEDKDGDGVYDKSTVFADKMTFPQGGCWLDGSLYVASPPGIWKLTDTNADGVADQREMIVGGFSYDGNAADVHGPFLHPNGRLFWCHGRKGHKVVQKDGTLVHEGLASGVWSCRPDGSDVQWHSLGSMDNPVEVDFTAGGDILGVVNLYYNQPRGDTLMHWLYGGVYERPDQLKAIAGLPRTRERMPIVHNFGHVAVSGCALYRSGALNPDWQGDMFVTFFNTQKIVRTKLVPAGASFTATEHEFLKINDPEVHITDLIEDGDGSWLVLDTGGWFRLGCPASLTAKPDFKGGIYRVQKKGGARIADPYGLKIAWNKLPSADVAPLQQDPRWVVRRKAAALARSTSAPAAVTAADLQPTAPARARLRAGEAIAQAKTIEPGLRKALLAMLGEPLDPALEHAAMYAAISTRCFDLDTLRAAVSPVQTRRLMVVLDLSATDAFTRDGVFETALQHLESGDPELAQAAVAVAVRDPRALERLTQDFAARLSAAKVPAGFLTVATEVATAQLENPAAQALVTSMLKSAAIAVRQAGWRVLSSQAGNITNSDWLDPLDQSLAALGAPGTPRDRAASDSPLLLEAIGRLRTDHFDPALQAMIKASAHPAAIRLKALAAATRPGQPISADVFDLLVQMADGDKSPTARIDAVRFLARSRLSKEQLKALAPVLQTAGAMEVRTLLPLARRGFDPELGRLWAESLARSPVVGQIEESLFRTHFSSLPPELYEKILGPVVRGAAEADDVKKRTLESLAAAAGKGRPAAGRGVFANSACAACHKAGDLGRAVGPDLSHIGQIRQPRDLLESILFPSATIARDNETHIVETADGQSYAGLVKNDSAEGLLLIDLAGQEKNVPQTQIVANTVMTTSLMPAGLEQGFTTEQLLDLVAWLGSLK